MTLASILAATFASAEIAAEQVAGKTLTLDKNKFVVGADGTLTGQTQKGEALVGTWEVKGGKWCRAIAEPARLAGSSCQAASIKGNTMTLVREDGSTIAYKIE